MWGKTFIIAVMAAVLCSTPALAGFNTGGQKGAVRTLAAPVMGQGRLNIGAGISIFQSMSYVGDAFKGDSAIALTDSKRDPAGMLSTNLFMCAGLTRFWDLAVALPFYYDWLGFDGITDNGIGDLEISTKFLYPPLNDRLFYQGYYAAVSLPAGMKSKGLFPRNPYYIEGSDTNPASTFYSSEYVTLNAMVLLTFDLSAVRPAIPLQAHLNFGGVISSSLQHQRNTAIVGLALEYTPVDILTLALDFHGESRWRVLSESPDPSRDPLLLSPSVRLKTMSGLYLALTGDISLSSRASGTRLNWRPDDGQAEGYRYSTAIMPNYGIQFSLGWCG
ncbi:MAG: hypothetical protein JW699_00710, partial [Chitinispirillaceae bacterium]|nr:hypothetical protein [Chitinispirillaceae bacterium]